MIKRTQEHTKATIVLLTPPPFDPRPHANKKPPADLKQADYRFPAQDYDKTLGRFSGWLVTLRDTKSGLHVIDLHTPINAHVQARRKKSPTFRLAGDGIQARRKKNRSEDDEEKPKNGGRSRHDASLAGECMDPDSSTDKTRFSVKH